MYETVQHERASYQWKLTKKKKKKAKIRFK